ncbi:hypothetical protein E2P79_01560 [Aeromonas schubertii]|nr:hypothetical protein E2P79_01560 [Aeromonas schubertii]
MIRIMEPEAGMTTIGPPMNKLTHPRLRRERRAMHTKIRLFCRHHHRGEQECDCKRLVSVADNRLRLCRFGVDKPTCVRCDHPCFPAAGHLRLQQMSLWARLPMLWRHPWLALRHWLDGQRRRPALPGSRPLPR